MRRLNSKDEILNAVEAVIAETGSARMSLDAVAHAAGVSKGGLLYNFPSKQLLIKALIDRHVSVFYSIIQEKIKRVKDKKDFLEIVLDYLLTRDEYRRRLAKAILTACLSDPGLLEPFVKIRQDMIREMKGVGINEGKANSILCALDGIILRELLQPGLFTPQEKRILREELLLFLQETYK